MALNVESSAARCDACGNGLDFDSWAQGAEHCRRCRDAQPGGARFVPGPAAASTRDDDAFVHSSDVPDALLDQIAEALLAAEQGRAAPRHAEPASPLRGVLRDLEIGGSPRELQWAGWGFALGFAGNVAVAKYAQMASDAAISEFVGPMLIGGLVAGAAAGVIGWGAAKLKDG